ncbi:MAG: ABC transporter substrate-binding protein [Halanaerobium sp.]
MKFKIYIILIILLIFNTALVNAVSDGGDLKVKVELRPFNLNPIYAENETELMINKQIFDTLVTYNGQEEVISSLAEAWEVNDDSKLFIFDLKKAVYFHPYKIGGKEVPLDEREVTAKDWKRSFEYLAAPNNESPYAELLNKIKGYEEYRQGESTEIIGIKVKDQYQLEIELKESYAPFIYNLAEEAAVVIPAEAVIDSNFDFSTGPVGTGPFKFDNLSKNKVTLIKNNNYWKNNYQAEELPYINQIEINFAAENDLKENLKEFDLYQLSSEEYFDYQKDKNEYNGYQFKKVADNSVYFAGLNYNSSLSQEIKYNQLQEILSYIINKNNFIDNLNLDYFILLVDDSNTQPFLNHLNSNLKNSEDINPSHISKRLKLAINDSKINIQIANDLQKILKAENINLEINKYSWAEYLNRLNAKNLNSQLFIMSADYNNRFEFIYDNFYSTSNSNYFGYQKERMDNLIDYLKLVNGEQKTKRAIEIVRDIIKEDNPFIFIFQGADPYLVSDKFDNQEIFKNFTEKYNFEELYLE